MSAPLGGYRPQCIDGPPTGDPHDIDGSHIDRCNEHYATYRRWDRAAGTYVRRHVAEAAAAGQPFDPVQARRQRDLDKPYEPRVRSSRARGLLPIDRKGVSDLRRSRQQLMDAKAPVDLVYRNDTQPRRGDLRALLDATDKHTALLRRLLDGVAET